MTLEDYQRVLSQLRDERDYWRAKGDAPECFARWLNEAITSIEGITCRYGWCDLNNGD